MVDEELSRKITELADEWLAQAEAPAQVRAGMTLSHIALFDTDGNEVARWLVGNIVAPTAGTISFNDITLTVT